MLEDKFNNFDRVVAWYWFKVKVVSPMLDYLFLKYEDMEGCAGFRINMKSLKFDKDKDSWF